MLNTAFGDTAIGKTQMVAYFSPNAGKLRLKIVGVQVVRPQITEAVRWRKFAESLTKTGEVRFRISQASYASRLERASEL
jgi:hypothetical protein